MDHETRGPGKKRPYRKKRRAELERLTRLRITESAVELHGTIGPARTSISAIAERAGVRRATVYRHFPDEKALFTACTSHWAAANLRPDLNTWVAIADADERLRIALGDLYAHYRRTQPMMENVLRDEARMPILSEMLADYRTYLEDALNVLMRGRSVRGRTRRTVRAALGHTLAFATWRSLTREQGLEDAQAAELMCRLVAVAAAS